MPTGTISKVTRTSAGMAFDLTYSVTNPSPPPATIPQTDTFIDPPEWCWNLVESSVGKTATVQLGGDPIAITSVTVTA